MQGDLRRDRSARAVNMRAAPARWPCTADLATHAVRIIRNADGLTGSVGESGPAVLGGVGLGGRLEVGDCALSSANMRLMSPGHHQESCPGKYSQ